MELTDLLGRGRTALVLTEVQESILGDNAPWPQLAQAAAKTNLISNAIRLAEKARAVGAPVVHCTAESFAGNFGGNKNARLFAMAAKLGRGHADNERDAPHPAIWREGDIKLPRFHGLSAMTGSPLDSMLRNAGVTTLIVAGVSLCFGVLSLTMDAVNRAYQVILPSDAVAGFPEHYAAHVMENTLAMLATIAPSDAIVSAWQKAAR